eukprot:CAMPEP_0183330466 /NCGR_PEP_ID=MMETSP0160_2-20130417/85318_1 /TAXON_ID=2839 ORGANISM="Odontella Sinensis, Strain Grunow 1884" /NCGR_SAMPLE_ID=MMETSP0160_2 /ASSEMBLY_ACC=CAM_ASM_000250 /LENGTH=87 /DNA_ID=CAMNT_0025498675 /DNA_START=449 /DNA_END=710 /DNA_ORIENTATION=-
MANSEIAVEPSSQGFLLGIFLRSGKGQCSAMRFGLTECRKGVSRPSSNGQMKQKHIFYNRAASEEEPPTGTDAEDGPAPDIERLRPV